MEKLTQAQQKEVKTSFAWVPRDGEYMGTGRAVGSLCKVGGDRRLSPWRLTRRWRKYG